MMRGDGIFSQALAKMMGHTLGQAPRVDKNKSGTMLRRECCDAIVDFVPHFVERDGAKLAAGNFNGQVEFAPMADLHDVRSGSLSARQKTGDQFDGLLRGRESDTREALSR